MDVKCVCFDWGGVILRICRSWEEGCAAAGIAFRGRPETPEAVAARKDIVSRYQLGLIPSEVFYEGLAAAVDRLYTPDEIRRVHDAWLIAEYPGIDDVLARLSGLEHVSTGLLSNTNAAHWARHLPKADGAPADFPAIGRLRYRCASHLLRAAKPTRDAFEAFEAAVGVRGDEILFFDDLEENVLAARAHGWRVERIEHDGDTASQISDHLRSHEVW